MPASSELPWNRPGSRRGRAAGARAVLVLAGLTLLVAFARLQVLEAGGFDQRARENRLRPVTVPAPRGTIRDREGRVLAENVVGHDVVLLPASRDSIRASLRRLAPVLDLDATAITGVLDRRERQPGRPLTVVEHASADVVARLQERRFLLPEVVILDFPQRRYPDSSAVAHVVGYVGEISREALTLGRFRGYRAGRIVGKTGVELTYETTLAGRPGIRYVRTDAAGRFRGWLPDSAGVAARPGRDIRLSLDLELQRSVAARFPVDRRGAFVALDPAAGGILALYSHPSFDPNRFVGGMPEPAWRRLERDASTPLLNRAIASVQPPASTWKPIVAAMALDAGLVEPHSTMPVPCRGGMTYAGHYYRCWGVHGQQDLLGAIQVSCDVYFYQLGLLLGLDRFLDLGSTYRLVTRTGVDLPGQVDGVLPDSRDWWRSRYGYEPREGEVLSLAIGQGPQGVTPLRLAQLYTAFARSDGIAATPWLVERLDRDRGPPGFRVSPATAAVIRQGLRRVVSPGGTAAGSRLGRWDFMGKTGTAQNPSGPDHAWFAAIAGRPGQEPDIVAVAFLEFGKHGADAARFVAEIVDEYLAQRHGPDDAALEQH